MAINRTQQFRHIFLRVFVKFPIDEAAVPTLQIELKSRHSVVIDPHLVGRRTRPRQLFKDTHSVFILPVGPLLQHASIARKQN